MSYYSGNKMDIISEVSSEIESSLSDLDSAVNFLEAVDWNEIFETVSDSDRIQSEIIDAIGSIRISLDNVLK